MIGIGQKINFIILKVDRSVKLLLIGQNFSQFDNHFFYLSFCLELTLSHKLMHAYAHKIITYYYVKCIPMRGR